MGSSVSEIYDDYDIYQSICERFGQEKKCINPDFYIHAGEILDGLSPVQHEKFKNTYWYNKFAYCMTETPGM